MCVLAAQGVFQPSVHRMLQETKILPYLTQNLVDENWTTWSAELKCPFGSTTETEASTSIDNCTCVDEKKKDKIPSEAVQTLAWRGPGDSVVDSVLNENVGGAEGRRRALLKCGRRCVLTRCQRWTAVRTCRSWAWTASTLSRLSARMRCRWNSRATESAEVAQTATTASATARTPAT